MTTDELRTLDADVHRMVMGYEGEMWHSGLAGAWMYRADGVAEVPRYSTDVAAAWLVVRRIEAGEDWNSFLYNLRDAAGSDDACDALQWLLLELDSPAEAICRAALKAVVAPDGEG